MISPLFQKKIEQSLSDKFNLHHSILAIQSIGGGSINYAFKLVTNRGIFFLKWNDANRFPGMFKTEAIGLNLLRSTNTFYIPHVVAEVEADEKTSLILEWIEPGKMLRQFWKDFGHNLARLHQHTSSLFGLDHSNYIGSLVQHNNAQASWHNFFYWQRLEPQVKIAVDSGKLAPSFIRKAANLYERLAEIIPEEKPSLLHGDLWNGNYMVASDGFGCLIDPAVYYGHREMDLAMTRLFGGFDPEFYHSYREHFPLEKNFESRVDIHNLYPLLVHVNLFGGGYIQQVQSILSQF